MDFREKYGQWGVVLGASMGIGAECAKHLASKGLNVVVVARSADKLEALAKEIKSTYHVEARALPIDLLRDDAWDQLDKGISDISVGFAVYSAAYAHVGGFLACDQEKEDRIMALNVEGSLKFSKYFGNKFCRQERGGMLYLGSLSGYYSTPYMALYSATKGFEILLAESLYGEFKQLGVDVTVGIIGSVDTPGLQGLYPDKEAYAAMKPGDPSEVARACIDAVGTTPVVLPTKQDKMGVTMLRKFMSLPKQIETVGKNTVDVTFQGKLPSQFPEE